MKQRILAATALITLVLVPGLVLAQVNAAGATPSSICDILKLGNQIARWFGIIVFIIAIVAILYAAFLFLTAGGNEESLSTAKKVLIYGIIGIAVALLATNAIRIIGGTIGGQYFTTNECSSLTPIQS
jgi:hypothetical protein